MDLSHWERYYRTGAVASCPTTAEGDYDQELRTVWESFLQPFPPGAQILDIGTGNGAVAGIANALSMQLGRQWQIHACDAAEIDPTQHVPDGVTRFAGVQFHPHVASEQLPFEDAQFDAVTGLYALEWSDATQSLPEIARVLKPGGQALFVLAHADAPMVESARATQRIADRIFTEWAVFDQLRQLLATPQLPPIAAQQQGARLQATIRQLKQALEETRGKGSSWLLALALEAVRTLLDQRRQFPPEAMPAQIDFVEQELRMGTRRLGELAEHACDTARMHALEQIATAAGLLVQERAPQWYASQQLVGWRLHLARA